MLQDLTKAILENPIVNEKSLADFKIPAILKKELSEALNKKGYYLNAYTSYAITDKGNDQKPANYAVIPNQYFSFACIMYDFSIELYKYFNIFEKVRGFSDKLLGSADEIKTSINSDHQLIDIIGFENINLFAKFLDRDDASYRLNSKRLINDQGKPRGSKDCFSSVVLKEINLPDSSSNIFGNLVFDLVDVKEGSLFKTLKTEYDKQQISKVLNNATDNILLISLPKPFILLAGISGTGKTRFVREQASAVDSSGNNYCLVSVRPDWHEPSDLLGYVTRLSGKPEYVSTKVLDFIIRAWRVIAPSADALGTGDLDLSAVPYWLCLDEMNLAPVEQYFADYLSVLETRQFDKIGEYSCEALLDKNLLTDINSYSGNELQKTLGLENNNNLWQYFLNHGIPIPPNLIVAGTVNMDETTHGFSRKVIDRALTIDFGEFFPNDYDNFFQSDSKIKPLTYSLLTQAGKNDLAETIDIDGAKSIAFLTAVNTILKQTPFELAYRALNELLLQVACSKPQTETHLHAVWDDFLMSKVLPRIDGDEDKLRNIKDDSTNNLLESLSILLEEQLSEIWNGTRLDFYRERKDGSAIDDISCRSKTKLLWMKDRLDINTFTSYWP
ncbi:MAG: hypothetical protein QM504_07750 [Pseudomonadota bacterium]